VVASIFALLLLGGGRDLGAGFTPGFDGSPSSRQRPRGSDFAARPGQWALRL